MEGPQREPFPGFVQERQGTWPTPEPPIPAAGRCVRCAAALGEPDTMAGALLEWKSGWLFPLQPEFGAGRRDRLCADCAQAFQAFLGLDRDRPYGAIHGVDPAHDGAHVDYEQPERGAIPPSTAGYLRLSVGDEIGACYLDVPRADVEGMTAGQAGMQLFEMLKELDARNAARTTDGETGDGETGDGETGDGETGDGAGDGE
jgi:hypothetical protein